MNISEILPGLVRWSVYSPAHKVELTSHAVVSRDLTLIFDPILPLPALPIPASVRRRILLTNANHERDALECSRHLDAEIWGPPDVEFTLPAVHRWGDATGDWAGWKPIPLPGGAPWVAHVKFNRIGYGRLDVKTNRAEHVSVAVRGYGVEFDQLAFVQDCAQRSLKVERYRQIAVEKIYDFGSRRI